MEYKKSIEAINVEELIIVYCRKDVSLNSYNYIEGELVLDTDKLEVIFTIVVEYKNDRYQAYLKSGSSKEDLKNEIYTYIEEDEYIDIGGTYHSDFANISYGDVFDKIDFIYMLKN